MDKFTQEQLLRWSTYKYNMYDAQGLPADATVLLLKSQEELAKTVVEIYCNASEEADPLYDYMIESMVDHYELPTDVMLFVRLDMSRDDAINVLKRVCKAWLIEFVYHGSFARINIPKDHYYFLQEQ